MVMQSSPDGADVVDGAGGDGFLKLQSLCSYRPDITALVDWA